MAKEEDKNKSIYSADELGVELYYKLELNGLPEKEFEIPADVVNEILDFQHDTGKIAQFYKALLYEFGSVKFKHLADATVHFLWKAKGGKSGGKLVLGKCKKPSGELKFYSDADFVILFSADHCHKLRLKNYQILALLYHELCHTAKDENGNFTTVGHEFEGFNDELRLFGAWKPDAVEIVKISQALPLFD
jgi:hypothetical protein